MNATDAPLIAREPHAWPRLRGLQISRPRPDSAVTLACVPYAGAGASAFRAWGEELDKIEVVAIQLPGREARLREPPLRSVQEMATEVAESLAQAPTRPLALFGHSMGAIVAFEATRLLESRGRAVAALVVSACRAPQVPDRRRTYELPDEQFARNMRLLGGTPQSVLDSPELMELVLPLLRADLQASETYHDENGAPVNASILALCGDRDPVVDAEVMEGWVAQTTSPLPFALHVLPGNHFFLHERRTAVLALVHQHLATALARQH